jgi:iron complex outermembrane receptor protein
LTAFYERFKRLRSIQIKNGALEFNNGFNGHSYGIEGWTTYRVNRSWRIDAGFLRLWKSYTVQPGSFNDTLSLVDDPKYQWQVRSTIDVSPKLDLSVNVRHVSSLPAPVVPSYTAVDIQMGYKLQRGLKLSLSVLNAQGGEHMEFSTNSNAGSEFSREIYLGLLAEF